MTNVHCCICLHLSGRLVEAATVIGGYATCNEHADLLSQPFSDFAELMRRVKTNLTERAT